MRKFTIIYHPKNNSEPNEVTLEAFTIEAVIEKFRSEISKDAILLLVDRHEI